MAKHATGCHTHMMLAKEEPYAATSAALGMTQSAHTECLLTGGSVRNLSAYSLPAANKVFGCQSSRVHDVLWGTGARRGSTTQETA